MPPVGKVANSTRSGASPFRGVAVHATTSESRSPGGVVTGGCVTGGVVAGGEVGGGGVGVTGAGGSSSPPRATAPPATMDAAATPPTITPVDTPGPPNPSGTDGKTAAGPASDKGATIPRVRHSSALSTTIGENSAVCPGAEPRSSAST